MITGINVVRDCITTGYPFIEAILSAYPLCDEYLVNDGGSTDGTLEALYKLRQVYPKLKIYNIPDEDNIRWDSVSNQINTMIQDARGEWIFLGNADELIHEDTVKQIYTQVTQTDKRVLRFNRRETKPDWSGLSESTYHPARLAQNTKNIRQDWNRYGGDEFLYDDGWPDPARYNKMNVTLYHFYNVFPMNKLEKLRNDAEYLAPGDKHRVKIYETLKHSTPAYRSPSKVWGGFPALSRGFPYMEKYMIRESLFHRRWVEDVTGLDYS